MTTLLKTKNLIGDDLWLPAWDMPKGIAHPQLLIERHNDQLAKRSKWGEVKAYSEQDLRRWDLPLNPDETQDQRIHRIILGVPVDGWSQPQEWQEWEEDLARRRAILSVPKHFAGQSYYIYNSALATTAAPVIQPTGTAIRTMVQLAFATGYSGKLIAWGCSFDGNVANTPGKCEVFANTVAATMSTAYAAADIQPYSDPNAVANTAGSSGVPFNLSTTTSGFATAAVTEGTVSGYRGADLQALPPTGPWIYQWPLGREFAVPSAGFLRVRMTFGTTVNTYIWLLCEF